LRRFRNKAAELREHDPTLSKQVAFSRAVAAMPRTANRYEFVRHRLGMLGVGAQKLW
jgi:hypothetical protein